jgi:hypothetical protein
MTRAISDLVAALCAVPTAMLMLVANLVRNLDRRVSGNPSPETAAGQPTMPPQTHALAHGSDTVAPPTVATPQAIVNSTAASPKSVVAATTKPPASAGAMPPAQAPVRAATAVAPAAPSVTPAASGDAHDQHEKKAFAGIITYMGMKAHTPPGRQAYEVYTVHLQDGSNETPLQGKELHSALFSVRARLGDRVKLTLGSKTYCGTVNGRKIFRNNWVAEKI